jgi:hypothetical protein
MPVPGVPAVRADQQKDSGNNPGEAGGDHGLIAPGVPAVKSNDGGNGYSTNIQKMDTTHSLVKSVFGNHKTIEFQPGYNATFYNATTPYCFSDNRRLL